jgi:CRISPR-associated endonuclease/helicase Cas3
MHTLHLHALDSRYATPHELDAAGVKPADLPPGFRLMKHQAHTIRELRYGTAPIIINTAWTADGKSFSGQYLVSLGERRGVTMYPTNELVADQQRSLGELKARWQAEGIQKLRVETITASKLDEIQHAIAVKRPEALKLLLNRDLLLTNPDIIHLMMQFRYLSPGAAKDYVFTELAERFNLFTFDEFHIFNTPQVLSALIMMLLLLETTGGANSKLRFLFLSATPQEMLTHLAAVARIPFTLIQGDYEHGKQQPNASYQRRILQRVPLYLYERGDGLEAWVEAQLDLIINFFRQHPDARGVILTNSVATAYRIHQRLVQPCHQAGIHLSDPNTGLTPTSDRKTNAQLFVATSTVDVGVDFKINLLIFESLDAATHIQRLGRLGRHDQNDKGEPFTGYAAYALLPQWVLNKVKEQFPDNSQVDRESYGKVIGEAYSKTQAFTDYRHRWAGIQAGRVLGMLEHKEIRHTYAETRTQLRERYKLLFPARFLNARLATFIQQNPKTFEEASLFRGSSPFTALVQNMLNPREAILPYNLIPLLQLGVLAPLPLDEAYRLAGDRAAELEKRQPLIAYRLIGWLPKHSRRVAVVLNGFDWSGNDFNQVIEKTNFTLDVEGGDVPEIAALNRQLRERTLVALLACNLDTEGLRWRYRLGMQLELFPYRSVDGRYTGSAAFGRDALLLDSLLYRDKPQCDEPMFG